MTLSIIIVSYNSEGVLRPCLNSLVKNYPQRLKTREYEIIVVDNASRDGTVRMVKSEYTQVRLIQNRENLGFGVANNQGTQKARGTFVLFLNPDTSVGGAVLPKMVEFMSAEPQVGISTCKVILPNGELDDASHRGFPTPWRALTYFTGLGKLFPHSLLFNGYHLGYRDLDKVHEIEACAGAFLLMRRAIGEKIGWFDADYFWYGEDLDLCYRVKQAGYRILFVPHVSILHQKGAASGLKKHSRHLAQIDRETTQRITKSRFDVMRIFYKKHYADKYPRWLTAVVFGGIRLKQKISEATL